jgi:hypothetical protein
MARAGGTSAPSLATSSFLVEKDRHRQLAERSPTDVLAEKRLVPGVGNLVGTCGPISVDVAG